MYFKRIASTCVAAALVFSPVQAIAGDALVGGIIGGIIGGAIVNESNKNRRTTRKSTTRSTPRSTVSSSQREANREVQVALNYFGFPVGTPDGAIGPKSRAAISQYQAMLGFAPTGNLNSWEQELLVQGYYRAQAGGAMTMQQVATDPRGTKGLLFTYRDEKLGVPSQAGQGGQMAAAPAPAPQVGFAAAGTGAVAAAVPQFGAATSGGTALPSFMGQGATQASLASHCNKVSLVTNSNGGFVTQVTMTDPGFTLSEQFCLARTYAIAQGEDLVSKVAGFTPQQISQQCEGFGPVMKEHVAALSLKSREEVMQGVSGFVLSSGMAPAQLAGTAKICLGVGYVTDNMDVAIGSALILTTLGEAAYGELMGHHLASGIGAAQRTDLALPWFDHAFTAGTTGATQVFAPGMADRPALIRLAAYSAAGRSLPGSTVPGAPVPASALPSFVVPGNSANP